MTKMAVIFVLWVLVTTAAFIPMTDKYILLLETPDEAFGFVSIKGGRNIPLPGKFRMGGLDHWINDTTGIEIVGFLSPPIVVKPAPSPVIVVGRDPKASLRARLEQKLARRAGLNAEIDALIAEIG